MFRKTKLAYQWVDLELLTQANTPSKVIGALFLTEFAAFAVFLVCLGLHYQNQMMPQESLVVKSALESKMNLKQSQINDVASARSFLVSLMTDGPLGKQSADGKTTTVLQNQRCLGGVWITQLRSRDVECPHATPYSCLEPATDLGHPFAGILSNVTLSITNADDSCPQSILCNTGVHSEFSGDFYPDSGVTLYYFNRQFFVNQTSALNASVSVKDVVNSYVDMYSRYVAVKGVALNAEGTMITVMSMHFEFSVAGNVFAWFSSRSFQAFPPSLAYEYVVWAYCAAFLIVTILRSSYGIVHRKSCVSCQNLSTGFCATSCSRCSKPICLDLFDVTLCSWCGTTIQAPQHSCWRTQLDPSRLLVLFNIAFIVTTAVVGKRCEWQLSERLKDFLSNNQAGFPLLDVRAALDQLASVTMMNAFNILIAFVSLYRFTGRAPFSSRFLRLFSSGGVIMGFFFVGFSTVFFGFMLSFHLLLGETTASFSTLTGAFAGTFQLLLGLLDWESVSASQYSRTFTALYLFFCWVCILVMVNVLISLVTVEYKRARKVKAFDIEAESCKMLVQQRGREQQAVGDASRPLLSGGNHDNVEDHDEIDLEDETMRMIHSVKENIAYIESSSTTWERETRIAKTIESRLRGVGALLEVTAMGNTSCHLSKCKVSTAE